ncbi:MAG: hypothetical protein Fur0037_14830 [Planctomycetota bacterium]
MTSALRVIARSGAALALLSAPLAWPLWLELRASDLSVEVERARAEVSLMQRRIDQADASARRAAPVAETKDLVQEIPEEPDVPAVLQAIAAHAQDCGVELSALGVKPCTDEGRVQFRVAGSAEIASLCAFLAAIERNPRILVVDGGSVEAADAGRVRFDAAVSAWHGGGGR